MNKLTYLKALFSPFKPFKLKWYLGKTAVGTPYFFPRKWVNGKAVPKKIGFDIVGLGWKTKWTETDYRFEWAPVFSFVFFGYQLAVTITAPYDIHYWEAWLYYENSTDKNKSKQERIEECIKEYPQIYKRWSEGEEQIIDYYKLILKSKYLNK